jgi:hypothetical protein
MVFLFVLFVLSILFNKKLFKSIERKVWEFGNKRGFGKEGRKRG